MIPWAQGSMDSLCGIYSILNAYKVVCSSTSDQTQTLFNEMIEYFSKKRMLKRLLINGMDFKPMNMVMKDVVYGYMPNYKLTWASFPNPTTKVFWNSMKLHLQEEGSCIILGSTGRTDHWTTGISCTSRSMKLMDGEWKFMKYSMCTTTHIDDTKYVLYPAQTFFIKR